MHAPDALIVPADALAAARVTADEARHELALALYEQERLTLGQAADLSGLAQADFLALAGERGLTIHYGVEEFEHDLAALRERQRR